MEALETNNYINFGKLIVIEYAKREIIMGKKKELIDFNLDLGYLEYENRSKKLYQSIKNSN